jgi:hypothetical protein
MTCNRTHVEHYVNTRTWFTLSEIQDIDILKDTRVKVSLKHVRIAIVAKEKQTVVKILSAGL